MSRTDLCFFLLLSLASGSLVAQKSHRVKWEPRLAFSAKIAPRWEYSLQAGGLQFLADFPQQEEASTTERLDLRAYLSYSFFRNRKLSLGYLYRKTKPGAEVTGYEHRLTLQYSFQNYWQAWRFGHRVATEQRWRNAGLQSRIRYRLSGDVPLQGKKLDVQELYFLASEELVLAIDEGWRLENRLATNLGWQISRQSKLELGLEFRFRDASEPNAIHLVSNLYLTL